MRSNTSHAGSRFCLTRMPALDFHWPWCGLCQISQMRMEQVWNLNVKPVPAWRHCLGFDPRAGGGWSEIQFYFRVIMPVVGAFTWPLLFSTSWHLEQRKKQPTQKQIFTVVKITGIIVISPKWCQQSWVMSVVLSDVCVCLVLHCLLATACVCLVLHCLLATACVCLALHCLLATACVCLALHCLLATACASFGRLTGTSQQVRDSLCPVSGRAKTADLHSLAGYHAMPIPLTAITTPPIGCFLWLINNYNTSCFL